ncbi:MAG: proline--tRNA ligase, partial [Clostridiales bacterium]|nr:proline--tRNA ligase [Clostridiales bacterium]
MAKEKNVEQITGMDVDFAKWYTDVCRKAQLIDYSSVKGMLILRPYGYAIWENIMGELDRRFKETGHENVSMPMLIPESLLQKEKDHVVGFAPECAWVTHGGTEELDERLCIRPTSETLFCDHWSNVLHSWRDLPMLYNQWCSVLRWEKTTRPFLRHREFLWQEGHTLHETAEEALSETEQQLETYARLCEDFLAMPVVRGVKTDKEKFAGAERTYTIECMMHDRKALQSGTSHYFGDGFAKAFDISFSDRENKLCHPHQTSWGLSTRIIGGIIMTHGDDNGLVLPPKIAPIQVVVLPIAQHKSGVIEKAQELMERIKALGLRCKGDFSDNSAGWKFAEYEMKGVPLRVEIGPKDIEAGHCVCVKRVSGEKITVSLSELEEKLPQLLEEIHTEMFAKAKKNLDDHSYTAKTLEEVKTIVEKDGGFVKTMWCGDLSCELDMKEKAGVSSRCLP